MNLLTTCITLALRYHEGQTDKGGKPYIYHLARVASKQFSREREAAAWLHDILEDTDCTEDTLRQAGIPERVIDIVVTLTRKKGEPYFDFIQRIKPDLDASWVKMEDLNDNMDFTRLNPNIPPSEHNQEDLDRVKKYRKAFNLLLENISPTKKDSET